MGNCINWKIQLGALQRFCFQEASSIGKINEFVSCSYDDLFLRHSHPSKCRANECALGIPSPSDMKNVVVGSLFGSINHLVFSKEGTYVIRLQDDILATVKQSECYTNAYLDFIQQHYDSLHRRFIRTKMPYKQYVNEWLEHSTWLGFEVDFHPDGTRPEVAIRHDCNQDLDQMKGAHETLDVIDSTEYQRKAGKKCGTKRKRK